MNYKQSEEILKRIKNSSKILLNCHRDPDADSIGSSTSLAMYIISLGKECTILSPSPIPEHLAFLAKNANVLISDFDSFSFKDFDLFLVSDTSSWGRVFNSTNFTPPDVSVVVIDNHETNKGFGDIDLLEYKSSSVCEMIFKLFEDWNIVITKDMAQSLLAGIVGDTGSFQFEIYDRTFDIAQQLMKYGANIKEINFHLFNSVSVELIKFWGLAIQELKIDASGFVYSSIPYSKYEPYSHLKGTRETAAGTIIRKVMGTKFGFVLTEDQPKMFSASFRSREDVDVAQIAAKLGGGGHPGAAGAVIHGNSFEEVNEKVVTLCREFLKTKNNG